MIISTSGRNGFARFALALLLPIPCITAQAPTSSVVGTGCFGMSLVTDELPGWTTAPFNFVVTGIPAGSVLNVIFWSDATTGFPIDLGIIGAPGCPLFLATPVLWASNATPVGTTDSFGSTAFVPPIFDTSAWIGRQAFFQALSVIPWINPLWMVTSNEVVLVGGV